MFLNSICRIIPGVHIAYTFKYSKSIEINYNNKK